MVREEEGLILRSQLFDPASDSSSAYERRRALIEQINGALAITHGARNLRLDRIVEILSDGTQRRHALLSAAMGRFRLKMRATEEVIGGRTAKA
jgi:hypothetical protein